MSEVASRELCEEFHKLSGWYDTTSYYKNNGGITINYRTSLPAYDLGYLLRKLPSFCGVMVAAAGTNGARNWRAYHNRFSDSKTVAQVIDSTPEDAACKLAIELFKQGVLKRED